MNKTNPIQRKILGTLGAINRFVGSDPRKVESELSPSDLDIVIPDLTETEKSICGLVDDRYKSAADNRRSHESSWFLSLAYYTGNQWVEWKNNELRPSRDLSDPHRVFTQRNKIRPKVKKLLTRALSSRPIANVAPITDSEIDRAATSEARAVIAHQDYLHSRQSQLKRLSRYCLTTSTVFLKVYWDATADADVPKMNKYGEVTGSTRSQVGEIEEDVVPCFEMYIDPKAHEFSEANWLIHSKVRSLDYVQTRYPHGKYVEAEIASGPEGYVDSRMAAITGDYKRGSEPGKKTSVVIKEMWEKPSARYPKGRLITVANGVLLRNDDWPFDKKDTFPFIPLSYEEGQDTVYGLNAVYDLIPAQRSYNQSLSRLEERERTAWGKILAPLGSEIGEGAFNTAQENEVIYHNPGFQPIIIPAPTTPPIFHEKLAIEEGNLNDISGVHEVSEGSAPPGVTAGNAIELLQQGDVTQMADFTESLEHFIEEVAKWEVSLASQFYTEPRLVALSTSSASKPLPFMKPPPAAETPPPDPGNMPPQGPLPDPNDPNAPEPPEDPSQAPMPPTAPMQAPPQASADKEQDDLLNPALQVQYFRALTKGGSCRITVTPGSATPKSPAAQNENIMNMFRTGLFGPPQAPESAVIALKLMDLSRSDEVIEWVMAAKRQVMADMAALAPPPPPPPPPGPDPVALAAQGHAAQAAQTQFQAQQAQQVNQDKLNAAQQAQQQKQSYDLQVLKMKQDFDRQVQQMKYEADLTKQRELIAHQQSHVAVSLSGSLGPTGTRSAEREAGLQPDTEQEAQTTLPTQGQG